MGSVRRDQEGKWMTNFEQRDEGYVKFGCRLEPGAPPDSTIIAQLNRWRDKLYDMNLIGAYPDGIGFGNLSLRSGADNRFVITGTATGSIPRLSTEHYTEVVEFDIARNHVVCRGRVRASSESMTHGVLYLLNPDIHAVIHIHHETMWEQMHDTVPTTGSSVAYGTPAMAEEMQRLYRESDLSQKRIAVMGGHREGIVAFGESLDTAGELLLQYYSTLVAKP